MGRCQPKARLKFYLLGLAWHSYISTAPRNMTKATPCLTTKSSRQTRARAKLLSMFFILFIFATCLAALLDDLKPGGSLEVFASPATARHIKSATTWLLLAVHLSMPGHPANMTISLESLEEVSVIPPHFLPSPASSSPPLQRFRQVEEANERWAIVRSNSTRPKPKQTFSDSTSFPVRVTPLSPSLLSAHVSQRESTSHNRMGPSSAASSPLPLSSAERKTPDFYRIYPDVSAARIHH